MLTPSTPAQFTLPMEFSGTRAISKLSDGLSLLNTTRLLPTVKSVAVTAILVVLKLTVSVYSILFLVPLTVNSSTLLTKFTRSNSHTQSKDEAAVSV